MATLDKVLIAVSSRADPDFVRSSLAIDAAAIMAEYGLSGPNEQAQLLGHMSVESGGYTTFAENLSYRAERLVQVWPTRFPSVAAAAPYAHNPRALANKVYNGRMGNRTGTDDGWNYRGSGSLQHTGESEFARVQKRTGLGVIAEPDLLRDKKNAEAMWRGACSYIVDRGALAAARAGDTKTTTIKINGGTTGLSDRQVCVARAAKAMGGFPIEVHGSGVSTLPVPEPPPVPIPSDTGTPVVVHPDPGGAQTTDEVENDARKKRNTAATAGTAGTAASGPAASGGKAPKTNYDLLIVGGIVIGVAVLAVIVVSYFIRRHNEAKAVVDAQQLEKIKLRVETAST
jgi:putative chitinase